MVLCFSCSSLSPNNTGLTIQFVSCSDFYEHILKERCKNIHYKALADKRFSPTFPQRKMAASPSVLLWGNDEGLTAPLAAWYSHRGEGRPLGQAWDTKAHLPCASCITTCIRTAGSVEKAGSIEPAPGSTTVAIHFRKKSHLLFSVTTVTTLSKRDGKCDEGLTWTSG